MIFICIELVIPVCVAGFENRAAGRYDGYCKKCESQEKANFSFIWHVDCLRVLTRVQAGLGALLREISAAFLILASSVSRSKGLTR